MSVIDVTTSTKSHVFLWRPVSPSPAKAAAAVGAAVTGAGGRKESAAVAAATTAGRMSLLAGIPIEEAIAFAKGIVDQMGASTGATVGAAGSIISTGERSPPRFV